MRTTTDHLAHSIVAASVPGGRVGPTITAVVGVAAVVIGWRTLRRHDRFVLPPTTVVGLGAAIVVAGVVFLALADDGPGSGNGVVGSAAAVMLGTLAIVLGAVALTQRGRVA